MYAMNLEKSFRVSYKSKPGCPGRIASRYPVHHITSYLYNILLGQELSCSLQGFLYFSLSNFYRGNLPPPPPTPLIFYSTPKYLEEMEKLGASKLNWLIHQFRQTTISDQRPFVHFGQIPGQSEQSPSNRIRCAFAVSGANSPDIE